MARRAHATEAELPNVARLGDARCATGTTLARYGAPAT
jgi:hypothetical protein